MSADKEIALLERTIRRLTGMRLTPPELADINGLEEMSVKFGGQVRNVPYSKGEIDNIKTRTGELRRLDTERDDDTARVQILDPDFVQAAIKHRDVEDKS